MLDTDFPEIPPPGATRRELIDQVHETFKKIDRRTTRTFLEAFVHVGDVKPRHCLAKGVSEMFAASDGFQTGQVHPLWCRYLAAVIKAHPSHAAVLLELHTQYVLGGTSLYRRMKPLTVAEQRTRFGRRVELFQPA